MGKSQAAETTDGPQNAPMEVVEPSPEDSPELTPEEAQFLDKRAAIAEKLKDDETFRQCIAEIYIFQSNLDMAMRSIAVNGGFKGIVKMMMGKGGD
jgi:hypothetical protein